MSPEMLRLSDYVARFNTLFPDLSHLLPWQVVAAASEILSDKIKMLPDDYAVQGLVAIHKDARVEEHVILKGPVIISAGCFIGAHAYIRNGVYIGEKTSIGPGCEVKSSFIMPGAALAHFNFAGDSIIGTGVNMEAGSIIANHYNERTDKLIDVMLQGHRYATGITKFGALVGDNTRIGANAVLSPGTILTPRSIVRRLELVEQVTYPA
ncbi:DapH/DapD/GlmU-related protein [Parachryseolinea silvisoli]|uniref:DapH/DapD/GlmU-related protein n=1 Tax=Parachryseolinea silvisoli TaxID=2873601 RepID=UPI002265D3B7|nr:DapH/DapD/GlmU-related protein [Parachryseolinea silvisoli]